MGYIPKFIHLDHFITVEYPFGIHGKHLIDPYYTTYSEYKWSNRKLPDYIFLTKEEKISD